MNKTTTIKIIASGIALLILIIRLIWPQIKIDAISLGLIIVAIVPWLSSILESAEFPGGWKIKFRDIQQAGEKITGSEASTLTTTTTTTLPQYAQDNSQNLSFIHVMDYDPNLALVALRIEIEKKIREIANIEGLSVNMPLSKLLRQLHEKGILSGNVFSGLQEVVIAGNKAAHGAKVEPSIANWAFADGPVILGLLEKKLDRLK